MDQLHETYYVLCQPSYNNCAAVVSYLAGYFKSEGLYFESSKDLCKADIVFFQNSNGLSHVGLCIDWDDNGFTTIEGNKDNAVKECYYHYSDVGGYVAGFAHPRYTDAITKEAVLAYARSQVGYEEGANNWNKYAEQLDAIEPDGYFAGCGKKQNLPWCAVFICACFYNAYNGAPTPTPTKDSYKVVTNSGDALRLRKEPNTSSEQVGYIDNNTTIEAVDVVEGESISGVTAWVKTTNGSFYSGYSEGYASGAYLSPTPQVNDNQDDDGGDDQDDNNTDVDELIKSLKQVGETLNEALKLSNECQAELNAIIKELEE